VGAGSVNAVRRLMKYQPRQRGVTQATWDLHAMGFVIKQTARRAARASN
jgi:hypothetical protein